MYRSHNVVSLTRAFTCFFLVSLVLSFSFSLLAQETRSTLFGRVLDPSDAPVANAVVVITNVDTNTKVTVQTNETGYFEAPFLLTGNYEISAQAPGFRTSVRSGIYLPIRTRLQADVKLTLGTVTETISVEASAPLLETDAITSGRVLSTRELADLPMPINNPVFLTNLTPGVQTTGGTTQVTNVANFIVKDQYTPGAVGGNEVLVDGVPNKTRDKRVAYLPQADTIHEFKVETSNFDASTGNTLGLNISMMTKAGTNDFHGSASWQHWQQRWGGTPFFIREQRLRDINAALAAGDQARAQALRDEPTMPSGHTNNYTGSIGGPVILPKIYNGKDRLFFFFSYTGTKDRFTETGDIDRTIPGVAERQGDFSQLLAADATRYQLYDPLSVRPDPTRPGHYVRDPIPGNIVPQSRIINPAADKFAKLFPTPNNNPASPNLEPLNNYVAVAMPWIMNYWAVTNRVDYQLSQSHRFFGRWTVSDWNEDRFDWVYESAPGLVGKGNNTRRNEGFTVDYVWMISPTTILNATAMYNGFREGGLAPVRRSYKPSDFGLPTYLDEKAGDQKVLPTMTFDGYDNLGGGFPTRPWYRVTSAKADITHIQGSHTIRGGFDMRHYYRNSGPAGGNTSGSFSFNNAYTKRYDDNLQPAGSLGHSWAAFLMGLPSGISIATNSSYSVHSPTYSWYVQDNWRVTRRLTLNVGLRLEYEQGSTERFNRAIGWFDPNLTVPIAQLAQAAYAANSVPELDPSQFIVKGGSVYPGSNGASRHFFQSQFMYLPRVSAAYQLTPKTVLRAGYGVFYDTLNDFTKSGGPNQFGYSKDTNTPITPDYGVTWLVGDPLNGVSPLVDPFPVRADGTRFDSPVGNALGAMAIAGRGFSYDPWDAQRARQQRWRIGIQRQIGNHIVVEAAYAGGYTNHVAISKTMQPLPEQYWADGMTRNNAIASNLDSNVANPFYIGNFSSLADTHPLIYQEMSTLTFFQSRTIRKNRLLRQYPHINGLTNNMVPDGTARYHSIELSLQRRFSKGFTVNAGYTGLYLREKDYYHNEFDTEPTERQSNGGRPHRFFATSVIELPFGKGRPLLQDGILAHVVGGWQMAVTYEYQPGPLLTFGNLFYYGDLADITKGERTIGRWFNTDNFERDSAKTPASYHRRMFPTMIDGLRADGQNRWNANIQREFGIREGMKLQLRMDVLNIFNRSLFSAPGTNPVSSNFGVVTGTVQNDKRWIQAQARVRF